MEKSCYFIGHRESDERLLPVLQAVVERLISEEHIRYFYVGCYGGFDRIATTAVRNAKQHHPEIVATQVLAYHPAERSVDLPVGFDGSYYPEGLERVPKRLKIVRVNQIMVDQSDWLVCCVRHGAGNSSKLLDHAKKREAKGLIRVENLAEDCIYTGCGVNLDSDHTPRSPE